MSTPFPSARHQAALATPTGYRRVTRCTFSRGGVSAVLEPTGGSFQQDARRSARWDGRLTFSGIDLPRRPGDLLTPFGTTVTIELGLELLDGSISMVPYGVYDIATSSGLDDPGSRTVTVGLIDQSDRVNRYRFEGMLVTGGTTLANIINQVVLNRSGVSPNLAAGGPVISSLKTFGLETGTGPWEELLDLAASVGLNIWYDRTGQIQYGSENPDPATAVPLPLTAGVSIDFDTRPANVVVARGESQDDKPPYQAVAMDTDPGSPTYAGTSPGASPYGRVTEFFSSPLITSQAGAQSAAAAILAANIGAGATHTLRLPYGPTLDVGDVVSANGVTFAIDSLSLDITGVTTGKLRELN